MRASNTHIPADGICPNSGYAEYAGIHQTAALGYLTAGSGVRNSRCGGQLRRRPEPSQAARAENPLPTRNQKSFIGFRAGSIILPQAEDLPPVRRRDMLRLSAQHVGGHPRVHWHTAGERWCRWPGLDKVGVGPSVPAGIAVLWDKGPRRGCRDHGGAACAGADPGGGGAGGRAGIGAASVEHPRP